MNNRYIVASTALASSACLGFLGYSQPEMLGVKPVKSHGCQIDYTKDNQMSKYLIKHSKLKQLLTGYKPSWFYTSALMGNAASLYLVPQKVVPEHTTLKVKSQSGQGGYVCYDLMRCAAQPDSTKVLFIVPGVNSSIEDHHINATARKALADGFHCVVVNPVRPDPKKGIKDLEIIDYSKVEPIAESVATIKQLFGDRVEIYAIGFSLGSNHLLRHLGAHKNCKEVCGIKAAVSISGAFEVRASAL